MKIITMHNQAIIIRLPLPGKHNVIALCNTLGLQQIHFMQTKKPCIGSLIEYTYEQKQSTLFASWYSIIDVPFLIAKNDILFLHHIFEIIYFFSPIGSCTQGIFALMQLLYLKELSLINPMAKKIFLCKLFFTLGLLEEHHVPDIIKLYKIINMPIDIPDNNSLDLAREEEIDQWLYRCISDHPAMHHFKTAHFLRIHRIV